MWLRWKIVNLEIIAEKKGDEYPEAQEIEKPWTLGPKRRVFQKRRGRIFDGVFFPPSVSWREAAQTRVGSRGTEQLT